MVCVCISLPFQESQLLCYVLQSSERKQDVLEGEKQEGLFILEAEILFKPRQVLSSLLVTHNVFSIPESSYADLKKGQ